jgi:hypothetical protein
MKNTSSRAGARSGKSSFECRCAERKRFRLAKPASLRARPIYTCWQVFLKSIPKTGLIPYLGASLMISRQPEVLLISVRAKLEQPWSTAFFSSFLIDRVPYFKL